MPKTWSGCSTRCEPAWRRRPWTTRHGGWQLQKRLSVMSAFVPAVEAQHNRRRALRYEKHIFGREVKLEL